MNECILGPMGDKLCPAIAATPLRLEDHELFRAHFAAYGLAPAEHVSHWLTPGDDRLTYVLAADGRPVGFACILRASSPYITGGADLELSELFIAPDERGRGLGAAAARLLFERHRGRWVLRILPRNDGARRFWARQLPAASFAEKPDDLIVRFDNRSRRSLGASGIEVGALGLGAGRIGGPEVSDADVDALVGAALEVGATLVDTARSYGASEERLGRALAGRRDRVVLSTKLGYGVPGVPDWTGPCIAAGVDAALACLGTDRIDIVHLHSCPREVLERGEVIAALAGAVAAGKVRAAAYSGEDDALLWAVRSGAFAVVQTSVSVVDQGGLDGAVAEASARGVGVLGKRPLGNAPWRFAAPPPEGDVAEAVRRFQALGLDRAAADWAAVFARFAAFAPGVGAILVGTAAPAHLRAVAEAVAAGPLPDAEVAVLRAAWARAGGPGWPGRI